MERERRINWLSLFIKIIIIFIFILIIIWLASKIMAKTRLSDTFKNNISNMETVATNYYKGIDLPLENGKSLKITLGEMIEKGLIVSVKDKKGSSCDTTKSFSKITRKKNNYILATTLKCGKEQNTITKKFSLKDCQNCQKTNNEKEVKNNKTEENKKETTKTETTTNQNNNTSNNTNNSTSTNNQTVTTGTAYYEHVKTTTTYTKWMKGNETGNNIENRYEYYGISKDTYYSLGIIKESDFTVGNTITYTLKINKVPNNNYYFTKVEDSSYYSSYEHSNYLKEENIELKNNNYVIAKNIDNYSLTSDNFTYTLSPYYRKGAFYIDVEVTITNTNNVTSYRSGNTDIYYVPLKLNIKFASSQVTETKPSGDYETISYYRYVQTNREVIWSPETYVEGYTRTGNTEIR